MKAFNYSVLLTVIIILIASCLVEEYKEQQLEHEANLTIEYIKNLKTNSN